VAENKKKLIAVVEPPQNTEEMTDEELDAYVDSLFNKISEVKQ
jgi:hypothetical protein